MSKRLASFRGPSTPTTSPVRQTKQNDAPSSPSRLSESTFHRKTRTLLLELHSVAQTWDDIVMIEGLRVVRNLIDTRTELDNALALIPSGQLPRTRIIGAKIEFMEKKIVELDDVIIKLQKQFRRMNAIVDNMEALLFEAHQIKGWQWCQDEPLWMTWSLEKFVSSISNILPAYHRSLNKYMELVDILSSHSVSFEASRDAIVEWKEQVHLEDNGWDTKWDDICAVEVERWNAK